MTPEITNLRQLYELLCIIRLTVKIKLPDMRTPTKNVPTYKRLALRLLIHIAQRFGRCSGRVVFLSRRTCIKYGPSQPLSEAEAMIYVAQHTSIPVPRIFHTYSTSGQTYIVMQRLKGRSLAYSWPSLDESSKAKILAQLHTYMAELRSLKPKDPGCISSVSGGPFTDTRLPSCDQHGPFSSVREFHKYLRNGIEGNELDVLPEVQDLIKLHETTNNIVCFTHSDLNPLNILVHNGRITGIVDWEFAGWMPLYWEYANACLGNPMTRFEKEHVDQFLEPASTALEMETLRRKYFGDF